MSAFIVGLSCMDRAVRGLEFVTPGVFNQDFRTTLGQDYFALNILAVSQRYGDATDMLPGRGWQPRHYGWSEPDAVAGCPPMVNSYKAMSCLIYQCSEGDVPERALYQALVAASQKLAHMIAAEYHIAGEVEDMPEYKLARWG